MIQVTQGHAATSLRAVTLRYRCTRVECRARYQSSCQLPVRITSAAMCLYDRRKGPCMESQCRSFVDSFGWHEPIFGSAPISGQCCRFQRAVENFPTYNSLFLTVGETSPIFLYSTLILLSLGE